MTGHFEAEPRSSRDRISVRTVIRVRILGGLGNQLFQYAAGLAAARAWGADLQLDCTSTTGSTRHPRHYMLDSFKIPAPRYRPRGLEYLIWKLRTSRNPDLRKLVGRFGSFGSLTLFDETSRYCFDQRLTQPPMPGVVSMVGYWQCAAYAAACEGALRPQLTFRRPLDPANQALLDGIRSEPGSVSVHVRRGDYLHLAETPVLAPTYYRDALDVLVASGVQPRLFVFSDTPDWARQALRFPHATVVVDGNGEDAADKDLQLMTACRHHIMANSSFSWWASWLGTQSGVVVAPKYWMMREDTHFPALFPPSWIAIDNRIDERRPRSPEVVIEGSRQAPLP